MNRQELKREHGSVKRQVMEQSTQAVWRAARFVLIKSLQVFWGHYRRNVRAMSMGRPHLQLEGIHGVADADANQIFEDDITAPDVIVQEDGSYSAEPMRLPMGSIYTYTAQQLETSPSTDHPLSEFEDGAPCIEPKPGSDDYFSAKELPSLTKSTIMDPSAIVPVREDHLKEDGDHTNAVIDVAWKCKLFEESKGKWAVKAISEKYDQGKSVEAKIALPESIRNLRLEDTCT